MSEFSPDEKTCIKVAKQKGLEVVFPRPDELMLDLDEPFSDFPTVFYMSILEEHIGVIRTLKTKSKSGNAHFYIQLDREITDFQRICLQACMNSDPKREMLSALRGIKGSSCPTLLYETPDQYMVVQRWRAKRQAPSKKESHDWTNLLIGGA